MHQNLVMIDTVAQRLGGVLSECVFVGGATVPFFITDPDGPCDQTLVKKLAWRIGDEVGLAHFAA